MLCGASTYAHTRFAAAPQCPGHAMDRAHRRTRPASTYARARPAAAKKCPDHSMDRAHRSTRTVRAIFCTPHNWRSAVLARDQTACGACPCARAPPRPAPPRPAPSRPAPPRPAPPMQLARHKARGPPAGRERARARGYSGGPDLAWQRRQAGGGKRGDTKDATSFSLIEIGHNRALQFGHQVGRRRACSAPAAQQAARALRCAMGAWRRRAAAARR